MELSDQHTTVNDYDAELEQYLKGMGFIFACTAEMKKCCKKYKKGKRCKKCPNR